MKKLWTLLKTFFSSGTGKVLADVAAATTINEGGKFLEQALIDFHAKKPNECKAMVASIYVWLDTSVEDLAAKTKTEYDDDAVDEAKKELEEFATEHGFTLSNLDAD